MVVKIAGVRMYMWRAVDDEGEVLDVLVEKRRNKAAAVTFLRRILKSTEILTEAIVTDGLYSYRSATRARLRRPPQAWAIAREQPGPEFSPAGATA